MSGSIKKFDKLCRDKVPDLIKKDGMDHVIEKLNPEDEVDRVRLLGYARKKVLEEAQEVSEAKALDEVLEECADLYEAMTKLVSLYHEQNSGSIEDQMRMARLRKRNSAGVFEQNYILKEIKHRAPKGK